MPFNSSLELRIGRFRVLVVCCFFALLSACGGDNSVNTSQTRQIQEADGGGAAGKSRGEDGGGAAGKSKITRLEITSTVSPAFAGRSFGDAGQYELLIGKAYGVADPDSPRNTAVTDLSGAPRNSAGLVDYRMDVAILKPIDIAKANGTLIYDVVNGGTKSLAPLRQLNGDGSFDKTTGVGPAGVGLEQGQVIVWSGWQGGVASSANATGGGNMAPTFPIATDAGGAPITGTVIDEFLLDGTVGAAAVNITATSFDAPLSYPPAEADVTKLTLTVQQRADDSPVTLPSSQMTFTGAKTVHVQRAAGDDLGAIYRITYRGKDPMVAGLGFVSVRDLVSFLRNDATDRSGNPNPLAVDGESAIETTIGTGFSQGGFFVREFIYLNFNQDESGRRVFDGMMAVGAGGKRVLTHQRFSQGRPPLQHEGRGYPGAEFPFTYPTLTDPVTGQTDGILARCSRSHSCPKVMQLDGEAEQWQSAGSLVVTDTLGQPVQLPATVRSYVAAGTPHLTPGGIASGTLPPNAKACENAGNPLSWAPLYRALILDLEAWLVEGTAPPDNRNPATEAEGRVSIDTLAASYPAIPGYTFSTLYNKLQLIDFSTDPWQTILNPAPYPVTFLRVNADGNAYDGIVLPEVAVPIATYAGRTTRKQGYAKGDLCWAYGAAFPFAKTMAERTATGDPRPSIEERYTSEADYREKLKAVADQLVEQRLMLPVDAEAYNSFLLPQ